MCSLAVCPRCVSLSVVCYLFVMLRLCEMTKTNNDKIGEEGNKVEQNKTVICTICDEEKDVS